MAEDSSSHKPHDPTPKKLEQARKQGEIVRSTDLNTAIVYGGTLLAGLLFGQWAMMDLGQTTQAVFDRAERLAPQILAPGGRPIGGDLVMAMMRPILVFTLVPAALLLAALVAQKGLLFTPTKLTFKLSRISPLETAKSKFGANGLFEFGKSAAKLLIYSVLLGLFLWLRAETVLTAIYASKAQILVALGRLTAEFLGFVFLIAVVLGAVDYLWQHAAHRRKNRMSHQDLVEENKQSEGDPHLKQERRQRGLSMAMNQMLQDVPGADVVVVNPTHFAVALKWERAKGQVPICVAKGVDEMAARIRERAAEHGVPVFHDPPTARSLYATVDIGAQIDPNHFRAVAAAIRFADTMRAKARSVLSR